MSNKFMKVLTAVKDLAQLGWYIGVPLARAKYPAETTMALAAIEELKKLKKARKEKT